MNARSEPTILFIAALFVLLSAMFDARVSAAIALAFLLGLAIYKLPARDKKD